MNSNTHSRKNSDNNYEEGTKGIEKFAFKSKVLPYSEFSQKGSLDKLGDSRYAKNDKVVMNQTDHPSSYFQLAMSRKVSVQPKR